MDVVRLNKLFFRVYLNAKGHQSAMLVKQLTNFKMASWPTGHDWLAFFLKEVSILPYNGKIVFRSILLDILYNAIHIVCILMTVFERRHNNF